MKVFSDPAEHDWIAKVLVIFQCSSRVHGSHSLALVHWFDWVKYDAVVKCDGYRLMDDTNIVVISVASIARKVAI